MVASGHQSTTTNEGYAVRTYTPKAADVTKKWYIVDAENVVLGRLATTVANLLRGKHKPTYAPHIDTGDYVIVINADKVVLTGSKLDTKRAYRHSGYPGGLRSVSYRELLEKSPEKAVEKAVRGMVPHTKLGRAQMKKLRVFVGSEHPHTAQQPETVEIKKIAQ
ncbi:ribosomal protein L13 [Winkia neuii]|nr:ribosomal protein L13 [Winkia neuii]